MRSLDPVWGCNRPTGGYDSASLRRLPARRPLLARRATVQLAPTPASGPLGPRDDGRRKSAGEEHRFDRQGYRPGTSADNGGWGSEEEHLMKYSKLGALGAGALLVFSACSGSTATTAPQRAPAPVRHLLPARAPARAPARRRAARPQRSPPSARTRRAPARARSTSTRASRSKARASPRPARSWPSSRPSSMARRSATSRSSSSASTTPRPPTRATGTARSSSRTPPRRSTTRTRWPTSAPTTRARRSCRSRS